MIVKRILSERFVRTWLILVILAVVMPIVALETHGGAIAAITVLALAAYKVRLVGLDFMEVRGAATQLRWAFEAYCVLMWLVLSVFYLK
ncbi:MAG: cytochrome C oxidase subunit IV family protein [Gordonia sp. (in: high G+C Gram-positive bacteria)]